MSETQFAYLPNEEIFKTLEKYVKENASVETWVGRNKVDNVNPMIVFNETRNEIVSSSTTYNTTTRLLSFSIDIYCKDRTNNYQIVTELAKLVTHVFEDIYHIHNGGIIAVVPSFDDVQKSSYQISLRYTTNYQPRYQKLY